MSQQITPYGFKNGMTWTVTNIRNNPKTKIDIRNSNGNHKTKRKRLKTDITEVSRNRNIVMQAQTRPDCGHFIPIAKRYVKRYDIISYCLFIHKQGRAVVARIQCCNLSDYVTATGIHYLHNCLKPFVYNIWSWYTERGRTRAALARPQPSSSSSCFFKHPTRSSRLTRRQNHDVFENRSLH